MQRVLATRNRENNCDVGYIGCGDVKTIECKLLELFQKLIDEFGDGLYIQKLWYTLSFEDHKDRKKLSHVRDDAFNEMCQADEDFDYHNTPPNSDGEEEEEDILRFKPGSGHLQLREVFDKIEDFKDALVEYALKGGWNIKTNKWGKIKSGAVCRQVPMERYGKWMVKTYEDEHKCEKDGYSKILKSGVILKVFMDEIRNYVDLKPRYMQEQVEQRFNLMTTIDKCKNAKRKALATINREHEEQFSRLKDHRLAILE
ncbi:hypothetical protein HA466_0096890 [Hirschfeldia incana]|nr:hypothetical protein HA466_0096890 [Hirschfeldia incana]